MCGGPVHMQERTKGLSLCGLNTYFNGSISQPLSFPYGSYAITCRLCAEEFERREKASRSLDYYNFFSKRDNFLDDQEVCRQEYNNVFCSLCINRGEGPLTFTYEDHVRVFLSGVL
jgi:hypothetical protein